MPRQRTVAPANVGDPVTITVPHTGNVAFNAIAIIQQAMSGLTTSERRNVQNWIERETSQMERRLERERRNQDGISTGRGLTEENHVPYYDDDSVPF